MSFAAIPATVGLNLAKSRVSANRVYMLLAVPIDMVDQSGEAL